MPIIDITRFSPKKDDVFFFDCNVLMYIFYSNGSYATDLVGAYSSLFTEIIKVKANILMTDVLLSEFVNTYIQTEFRRLAKLNNLQHDKRYFKTVFKFSNEYKEILKELEIIIKNHIIPIFTMTDITFSKFKYNNLFNIPEKFDFNDRYYGHTMSTFNAYIITHDADFSVISQCNIITKNQNLLNV